jgi:hypothetical protein
MTDRTELPGISGLPTVTQMKGHYGNHERTPHGVLIGRWTQIIYCRRTGAFRKVSDMERYKIIRQDFGAMLPGSTNSLRLQHQ